VTRGDVLHVWLHGEHVAKIERLHSGCLRLRFTPETLGRWGVGTRLLSYSLPLTTRQA